jgi:predicted phosphodiesterase
MKISICSDVHLEFGELDILNTDDADVLVCAGDITLARAVKTSSNAESPYYETYLATKNFFDQASREFDTVIYVAGNHEFYNYKWNKTLEVLSDWTVDNYNNVYFLEDNHLRVNGVEFYGSTLWTDMNNMDPLTMMDIQYSMNDYAKITYDSGTFRKLKAKDSVSRHVNSKNRLRGFVNSTDLPVVVVTHHGPSSLSNHPRYPANDSVNWAYYSNLEEDILDFNNVPLWFHGHTHNPHDYHIGNTRVVCNPRGYIGYESLANKFMLKTVEI